MQGGTGDWSGFFKYGTNGYLTVLYAALALRDDPDSEQWAAALQDVSWVIHQVVAAARARRYV